MRFRTLLLLGSLMLVTVALVAQQTLPITVTGTISDTMCAAHHMMKNTSAAECTRQHLYTFHRGCEEFQALQNDPKS